MGSKDGKDTRKEDMTETYPSNSLARSSGIKRMFWSGSGGDAVYQMVLSSGGLSTTYVSPVDNREPLSAMDPTPYPVGPGLRQIDYENWLRKTSLEVILEIFKHFPTYTEWVNYQRARK